MHSIQACQGAPLSIGGDVTHTPSVNHLSNLSARISSLVAEEWPNDLTPRVDEAHRPHMTTVTLDDVEMELHDIEEEGEGEDLVEEDTPELILENIIGEESRAAPAA